MEVVPLVDQGLGNGSYLLVVDEQAVVVDPWRDPRDYLEVAAERGVGLRWVIETHLHADFVSGARELTARGAQLLAPRGSALAYGHRPLDDGDELELAGLTIRALATPGHTPEHLAYLVTDGDEPVAVFTGGALISGGVARPDLLGADQTVPLAKAAHRSLLQLLALPDDLPVYPTHGGGSFCSAGAGGSHTTTIGAERAANPLAAVDDQEEFVERLLAGLGSFPPYFLELRDVNRAGVAVHGPVPPPLPRLAVEEVDRAVEDGAELVDVRSIGTFAAGHLPGSLSIPWRSQFPVWLGWLVSRDRPVVFVADDAVDRQDLVWAALSIGHERLVGELASGIEAWTAAGRPLARTPLVDADDAERRRIVDIRQHSEFTAGHVPGAVHVELGSLTERADAVPDGPMLVHCGHGERAMSAASLLQRAGHGDVAVLAGGPDDLGELEVGG